MAHRKEQDIVLILSDLNKISFGGFEYAHVLPLLTSLNTENGDFFANERLEEIHIGSLTLSKALVNRLVGPNPQTTRLLPRLFRSVAA